mgnify:CR=1 FL=1
MGITAEIIVRSGLGVDGAMAPDGADVPSVDAGVDVEARDAVGDATGHDAGGDAAYMSQGAGGCLEYRSACLHEQRKQIALGIETKRYCQTIAFGNLRGHWRKTLADQFAAIRVAVAEVGMNAVK